MYSLMAYGISPSTLPVQTDGKIDTTEHEARLAELASLDMGSMLVDKTGSVTDESTTGQALVPTPEDVLLGRGKHGKKWPGNLRLRKLVDDYNDAYKGTDRDGKIAISHDIYDEMVDSGVRFLVPSRNGTSDGWVKMPRREVCIRISHLFRNLRASERTGFGSVR